MRRRWRAIALAAALVCLTGVAVYFVFLRTTTSATHRVAARPASVIGSGRDAVPVAADGTILLRRQAPKEGSLPMLPLASPPRGGKLGGPVLAQARVLGAAPAALRGCVERSYYGESGIDVILDSGIELRFGDASRAEEKWAAAATVLADPSVTALDYVDLHAPRRPTTGGSGHPLPAASEGPGAGCG